MSTSIDKTPILLCTDKVLCFGCANRSSHTGTSRLNTRCEDFDVFDWLPHYNTRSKSNSSNGQRVLSEPICGILVKVLLYINSQMHRRHFQQSMSQIFSPISPYLYLLVLRFCVYLRTSEFVMPVITFSRYRKACFCR